MFGFLSRPLLGASIVAALVACDVTYSSKISVAVPGDTSIEQKSELTQRVASALEADRFRERIAERVPTATRDQLDALHIAWTHTFAVSVGTDGAEAGSTVYIQCVISSSEKLEDNHPVLESCKELVEEELSRQLAGERAA